MAKIDRAMYFINKHDTQSGSNLTDVSRQFFLYWKLCNLYRLNTREMNAENIFNGFTQLLDYTERNSAKDLYVNNEIDVESNVEIEFETYDLNVSANSVAIDNLNEVAFNDEEFEVDEDIFHDDITERAREFDWYVESADNSINWTSIESDLVEPLDDVTLIYMYDESQDIHSTDVDRFIATEVNTIHDNNQGMTNDAYISFMFGELNAQIARRNAPPAVDDNTGELIN